MNCPLGSLRLNFSHKHSLKNGFGDLKSESDFRYFWLKLQNILSKRYFWVKLQNILSKRYFWVKLQNILSKHYFWVKLQNILSKRYFIFTAKVPTPRFFANFLRFLISKSEEDEVQFLSAVRMH